MPLTPTELLPYSITDEYGNTFQLFSQGCTPHFINMISGRSPDDYERNEMLTKIFKRGTENERLALIKRCPAVIDCIDLKDTEMAKYLLLTI